MAWVALKGSPYLASELLGEGVTWSLGRLVGSGVGPDFTLTLTQEMPVRITVESYSANNGPLGATLYWPGLFEVTDTNGDYQSYPNTAVTDPAWSGVLETWTPGSFEVLALGVLYRPSASTSDQLVNTESWSIFVEVDGAQAPPVEPVAVTECEEIGPATRVNVSAYQRTRGVLSRLVRGERRCLVVNFNGAIPATRSIASAVIRTNQPHAVSMTSPRIVGREVIVDLSAQAGGHAEVKVEATLDNGERYTQGLVVHVQGSPWFEGETTQAQGVRTLTVTA